MYRNAVVQEENAVTLFANTRINSRSKPSREQLLKALKKELKVKRYEDWYGIQVSDILKHNGKAILKAYNDSPSAFIMASFPQYDWQPWRFGRAPKKYWEKKEHIAAYMKWLGKQMGFTSVKDWYRITKKDFIENYGTTLLKKYKNSPNKLIVSVFDELLSLQYRESEFLADYIKELAKKLKIRYMDDWYAVTYRDFSANGGTQLLRKYGHVPANILMAAYPDYLWQLWRFERGVPPSTWQNKENELQYMEWLGKQMKFHNMDCWYKIKREDFVKWGMVSLLKKYKSPPNVVKSVYCDRSWYLWKFDAARKDIFNDPGVLKQYFDHIGPLLGKHTKEDWENSSPYCLLEYKLDILLRVHGTLIRALKTAYPDLDWKGSGTSKGQSLLKHYVVQISREFRCPSTVLENVHPADVLHIASKRPIELDIYVPQLHLAFEYHGAHHYKQTHRGDLTKQRARDREKIALCKEAGITLICIPYRWSGKIDDLRTTIHHYRPDVFDASYQPKGEIIPSQPLPTGRSRDTTSFMLATEYRSSLDPTGWWLSEKYDGFRVMWIGSKGYFVTRGITVIHPPPFFAEKLPKTLDLDGELWLGRGQGPEVRKLVQRADSAGPEDWKDIKFMIFDYKPEDEINQPLYEQRMELLQQVVDVDDFIQVAPITQCTGHDHLSSMLEQVLQSGGEGLMLRQPSSKYFGNGRRCYEMQKLKNRYISPARIVSALKKQSAKGEYITLQCLSAFDVPFGLHAPPCANWLKPILESCHTGNEALVTIQYFGLSPNQVPLSASCVQHHPGIQWKEIVWYTVTLPENNNRQITCYACRAKMAKNELTITTCVNHKYATGGWMPLVISFHPDPSCLNTKLPLYHKQKGSANNVLKPFENRVALDPLAKSQLTAKHWQLLKELQDGGVEIIEQELFYKHAPANSEEMNTASDLIESMKMFGIQLASRIPKGSEEWQELLKKSQVQNGLRFVHPQWRESSEGAITSSNPNIASIPKEIRNKVFSPAINHIFMAVDFDQIGFRVIGNLCPEGLLRQLLSHDTDIGEYVAAIILQKPTKQISNSDRNLFKSTVLAVLAGGGDKAVINKLQASKGYTVAECHRIRNQLLKILEVDLQAKEEIIKKFRQDNCFRTLLGNQVPLQAKLTNNQIWNLQVKKNVYELVSKCSVSIWQRMTEEGIYDRCGIAWIVYDELMLEIKANDQQLAKSIVSECIQAQSAKYKLAIPLQVKMYAPRRLKASAEVSNKSLCEDLVQ